MQSFGVLVITGGGDHGQSVEAAVGPLAKEQLPVVKLPPVHPIAYLHHEIGFGNPPGKCVVIGSCEAVVNIPENEDGKRRVVVKRMECGGVAG
jgi:hypothetical protein